jgi:PIN domain nuclease of toxin-antitoxin system
MKVLLDTHTFLWAITEESKLSQRVRLLLLSAESWFSVVSLWEILTKVQIGKLSLPRPVGPFVTEKLALNRVHIPPIRWDHVLRVETLELHHRDPFDRLLIAQSLEENVPLVSADPLFQRYAVQLIW